VLFDPQLRDSEMAIELREVTAQTALETLMRAAGHFYKVIDEQTILIAADNQQNRRAYEDLVIQTFYLSNAEVKDMMTLLRSLVGAKNIASNDQLNAIVLKDTADTVQVAERIIESNDKARGEVVIDVELLQIDTNKIRELGVSLSSYQASQSLDQDPPLRVSDLEFLDQSDWILALPSFLYDFVKSSTEAQLLANPQVRISDGEEASLTIGDRVPIPVTTFNTAQTVGGNIVPITSFQYQDVGIRLQIEPRLHHNREVTLDLEVEVANLAGFVEGSGGQQQPIIGTRNFQSTIRLMDGETNFLAGLIRDDHTLGDVGFPGLSDIPVLGRLFAKKSTEKRRTDLVLTLTPHIIRSADITEEDLLPIWVGTEQDLSFTGGSPRVDSDVPGPFEDEEDAEEQERIREMIRQRIQSLPEGIQEGVEGTEGEPSGLDLAPSGAPIDVFGDEEEEEDEEEYEPPGPRAAAERGAGLRPVLALARGLASTPPVRLAILPAAAALVVGDELTLELVAQAETPVSHFPLRLRFDPTRLAVLRVEAGDFLGGEGEAVFLADSSNPGEVVLGASRVGEAPGVVGRGVVARLT
ncbi:MAG: secretin N-terminal domain-containing protein, partial [Thermoanaerobaculia bacterium]